MGEGMKDEGVSLRADEGLKGFRGVQRGSTLGTRVYVKGAGQMCCQMCCHLALSATAKVQTTEDIHII